MRTLSSIALCLALCTASCAKGGGPGTLSKAQQWERDSWRDSPSDAFAWVRLITHATFVTEGSCKPGQLHTLFVQTDPENAREINIGAHQVIADGKDAKFLKWGPKQLGLSTADNFFSDLDLRGDFGDGVALRLSAAFAQPVHAQEFVRTFGYFKTDKLLVLTLRLMGMGDLLDGLQLSHDGNAVSGSFNLTDAQLRKVLDQLDSNEPQSEQGDH